MSGISCQTRCLRHSGISQPSSLTAIIRVCCSIFRTIPASNSSLTHALFTLFCESTTINTWQFLSPSSKILSTRLSPRLISQNDAQASIPFARSREANGFAKRSRSSPAWLMNALGAVAPWDGASDAEISDILRFSKIQRVQRNGLVVELNGSKIRNHIYCLIIPFGVASHSKGSAVRAIAHRL